MYVRFMTCLLHDKLLTDFGQFDGTIMTMELAQSRTGRGASLAKLSI